MEDLFFENQNYVSDFEALPSEQDGSATIAIVTIVASIVGGGLSSCSGGE